MNAIAPMISFEPAYRQISAGERAFVDSFVADLENIAARQCERLTTVLNRSLPDNLDDRSRAMLDKPLVRAAIVDRVRELAEDAELSEWKTLKELRSIAYSSIANYVEMRPALDSFGNHIATDPVFDLSRCTPEQLGAIKSIKYELNPRGGHKFEFVLHDKLAALDKLMRYQGLLSEDHEHWRADQAKTINAPVLNENVSDDEAADVYARMING